MRCVLATSNLGKQKELSEYLAQRASTLELLFPQEIAAPPKVVEDGNTYGENAFKKAKAFFETYQLPVLSDDSGLEVAALGGRPGIHSARYGGNVSWRERCQKILAEVKEVKNPSALFRCVLCFYDGKNHRFFEGTVTGYLVSPRGNEGFGYDPIFFSTELGKTFGEATSEEKDRVSHRARALEGFLTGLEDLRG